MIIQHKNKVTTAGYFLKRLKDSGFIAIRIFKEYGIMDPRRWTVMIDPGGASLLITCYENKDFKGEVMFEFNDGGNRFPKNHNLKTKSMEVVVTNLIERGIPQKTKDSVFEKVG